MYKNTIITRSYIDLLKNVRNNGLIKAVPKLAFITPDPSSDGGDIKTQDEESFFESAVLYDARLLKKIIKFSKNKTPIHRSNNSEETQLLLEDGFVAKYAKIFKGYHVTPENAIEILRIGRIIQCSRLLFFADFTLNTEFTVVFVYKKHERAPSCFQVFKAVLDVNAAFMNAHFANLISGPAEDRPPLKSQYEDLVIDFVPWKAVGLWEAGEGWNIGKINQQARQSELGCPLHINDYKPSHTQSSSGYQPSSPMYQPSSPMYQPSSPMYQPSSPMYHDDLMD